MLIIDGKEINCTFDVKAFFQERAGFIQTAYDSSQVDQHRALHFVGMMGSMHWLRGSATSEDIAPCLAVLKPELRAAFLDAVIINIETFRAYTIGIVEIPEGFEDFIVQKRRELEVQPN